MMKLSLCILSLASAGLSLYVPDIATTNIEARLSAPQDTKYFHEPPGGYEYGHYDIRYFPGAPVNYEQKQDTLRHLVRSYLQTFRSLNIETWLAHGSLLGWWWNGQIMPWDWDLDTQVSGSTLLWLGENMNMTTHNYTFETDKGTETREYLLDVNQYVEERVRGDGNNIIDARWIDTRNGLFIDITGLSETEPERMPGVWNCKNYHRYLTKDIYPLRESVFEDTPALVPYSFDNILIKEYSQKALVNTIHEGHQWVPSQKAWVKVSNMMTARKQTEDEFMSVINARNNQADVSSHAGEQATEQESPSS